MDKEEIKALLKQLEDRTISASDFERLKQAFDQDDIEDLLFEDIVHDLSALSSPQSHEELFDAISSDSR
ncbi:MAG: hypothetical protein LBE37_16905, partial [Sphingobacterium sp.]|nr:hypothetical protein [Sphingobacterium sp.]